LILNPGAWTHYSWAIRDALEITDLPAVEVHLSAVDEREEWAHLGDPRPLHRGRAGAGGGGLPRGALAPAGALRRMTRADRLIALLGEPELDSLLVTNLVNVRYLSGFTGTNGACIVSHDERLFVTDSRYVEQARQQVTELELVEGGR